MDEMAALAAAAQGDSEAFRALVEAYQDRVFGHVLSMVGRREQAEDLTQEIFVKAYFALPRFKKDAAFFTWLYRIASNHCLDFLRKKHPAELPLDAPVSDRQEDLFADLLAAPAAERPETGVENAAALADLLNEIDPEQKLILVLRELEGQPYEALAQILDCPVNTVKSRLNRAREALKAVFVRKHGNILPAAPVQKEGEIRP